jgi:hypothetical protein
MFEILGINEVQPLGITETGLQIQQRDFRAERPRGQAKSMIGAV